MSKTYNVEKEYQNMRFDKWFKKKIINLPQSLVEKIIRLNKVKIKSINMIKKHLKPSKENKGGIVSKESFIDQSNIKNLDQKKKEKKTIGKK